MDAASKYSERKSKLVKRNKPNKDLVLLESKAPTFERNDLNSEIKNTWFFTPRRNNSLHKSIFYYNPQSACEAEVDKILKDDTQKCNNGPPSPRFGDEISFGERRK